MGLTFGVREVVEGILTGVIDLGPFALSLVLSLVWLEFIVYFTRSV